MLELVKLIHRFIQLHDNYETALLTSYRDVTGHTAWAYYMSYASLIPDNSGNSVYLVAFKGTSPSGYLICKYVFDEIKYF
jgi:hypothetical protein